MSIKSTIKTRLDATREKIAMQITLINQQIINLLDQVFLNTLQLIRLFPRYSMAIILGAIVGITRALISPIGLLGGIIAFNLAAVGLLPAGIGLYAAFLAGNMFLSGLMSLTGIVDNYVSKRENIEKKAALPQVNAIEKQYEINHAAVQRLFEAAATIDKSADTTLSSSIEAGMIVTNLVLNLHGMPRLYNLSDAKGAAKRIVAMARGD